jgi:hypothetical protein
VVASDLELMPGIAEPHQAASLSRHHASRHRAGDFPLALAGHVTDGVATAIMTRAFRNTEQREMQDGQASVLAASSRNPGLPTAALVIDFARENSVYEFRSSSGRFSLGLRRFASPLSVLRRRHWGTGLGRRHFVGNVV